MAKVTAANVDFLRSNLVDPLRKACSLPATDPGAVQLDSSDVDLGQQILLALGAQDAWNTEPRREPERTVVARSTALQSLFEASGAFNSEDLRAALSKSAAGAITTYLQGHQHPFSLHRGLPPVQCDARDVAGHWSLELVFPGCLSELEAMLVPDDLLSRLDWFVLSRVSSFAVGRDSGKPGFLPHAIAAGDSSAVGCVLASAGIAGGLSLPWTAEDVVLDAVGDFTSCVDPTTATVFVPLSQWRAPQRLVNFVCVWASDRGVTVSDVDVARAIRDDVAAAMASFLGSDDGGRSVSLASHLRVTSSTVDHVSVLVSFAGNSAALTTALQRVQRPELMRPDEVTSLRDSEMLYSVLHAAVFKLQVPLAMYLREQLPLFYNMCLADSDEQVTKTDRHADDHRHIANAVYRIADLPGDPLDDDWTDGRDGTVDPVLSDGRCIVAVSKNDAGLDFVWTVTDDTVRVGETDPSKPEYLCPDDKAKVGAVMVALRGVKLSGDRRVVSVTVDRRTRKPEAIKVLTVTAAGLVHSGLALQDCCCGHASFDSDDEAQVKQAFRIRPKPPKDDKGVALSRSRICEVVLRDSRRVLFSDDADGGGWRFRMTGMDLDIVAEPGIATDSTDSMTTADLSTLRSFVDVLMAVVLARGRRIITVDDVGGGRLVLGGAMPLSRLSTAVCASVNHSSFSPDDKVQIQRAVQYLTKSRGVCLAVPSSLGISGTTWIRPPRRRDTSLRFSHVNLNAVSEKSFRDGGYTYSLRDWYDAAKLFMGDVTAGFASVDTYTWDMSNLIGSVINNPWMGDQLSKSNTGSRKLSGGDVINLAKMVRDHVRNRDAHMSRISPEVFDESMRLVMEFAELVLAGACDASPSPSVVADLEQMRCSPRSYRAKVPFPSFDDEAVEVLGRDSTVDQLVAVLLPGSMGSVHRAGAGAGAGGGGGGGRAGAVIVLSGLPGVGKSTVARLLCRQVRDCVYYDRGIFWLSAESPASLYNGYRRIAAELLLPVRVDTSLGAARDAVFGWMLRVGGWLVVMDNMDDSLVAEFMPPPEARGDVVITSGATMMQLRLRCSRFSESKVDCLDESSSISLLCRRCDRDEASLPDKERRAAAQICRDGLPDAIRSTAAFIVQADIRFAEYVVQCEQHSHGFHGAPAGAGQGAAIAYRGWGGWLHSHSQDLDFVKNLVKTLGKHVHGTKDFHALAAYLVAGSRPQSSKWSVCEADLSIAQRDMLVPVMRTIGCCATEWASRWEMSTRWLSAADVMMMWLLCRLPADDVPVDAIVTCIRKLPQRVALRRKVFADDDTLIVTRAACVLCNLSRLSLVSQRGSSTFLTASTKGVVRSVVWDSCPADLRAYVEHACVVGLSKRLEELAAEVKRSGIASDAGTVMQRWLPLADAVVEMRLPVPETLAEDDARAVIRFVQAAAACNERAQHYSRALSLHREHATLLRLPVLRASTFVDQERVHSLSRQWKFLGLIGAKDDAARVRSELDKILGPGDGMESSPGSPTTPADMRPSVADLQKRGKLCQKTGLSEKAVALYRRSVDLLQCECLAEDALPVATCTADHDMVVTSLRGLANSLLTLSVALPTPEFVVPTTTDTASALPLVATPVAISTAPEEPRTVMPELVSSSPDVPLDAVDEAIRHLRVALDMRRRHAGDDHCDYVTAGLLQDLAGVLHSQGKLLEAARLYHERLVVLRREFVRVRKGSTVRTSRREVVHDADVAATLRSLAKVLHSQGDLEQSEKLHRESLVLLESLHGLGRDHRLVAESLRHLADVLYDKDDLTEAERLYRKSLDMFQRVFGMFDDHGDIATTSRGLATALYALEHRCEAHHHVCKALEMFRRLGLGVEVAVTMRFCAVMQHADGDLDSARRSHLGSLEILDRMPAGHCTDKGREVALSLRGEANVLHSQHHYGEAYERHRDAFAMLRRFHGAIGTDGVDSVATSLRQLARQLDVQNALPAVELPQQWMRQLRGECVDHRDEAESLSCLAAVLHARDDLVGSAALYTESLAMFRRLYGRFMKSRVVATSLRGLAEVLRMQGDGLGAERLHCEALEMYRRVYGEGSQHSDIKTCLRQLSEVQQQSRRSGDTVVRPQVPASIADQARSLRELADSLERAPPARRVPRQRTLLPLLSPRFRSRAVDDEASPTREPPVVGGRP
jgi:tetratricopeptide (TPR) repeat protein